MPTQNPTWLTTGQAARMCAVTPATVLNWIRTGQLDGVRTPGGHYRIRLERLQPLMVQRRSPDLRVDHGDSRAPLRCWEYLSDGDSVRQECQDCVVFRVRAAWCFQIASLGLDTGHSRRFCPTSCDDCAYYRRVKGLPTNVLIVSSDADLLQGLEEGESEGIVVRFAQNAYEASAVVESFIPAFAIVDLETSAAKENGLLESLSRDPRLPGLKTIVAVRNGRSKRTGELGEGSFALGRIEKPFDLQHIQSVIDSFPVEVIPLGGAAIQGPRLNEELP